MEFTTAQQSAVGSVLDWYNDPRAPQVHRLFGYAGSGKTTLAKTIAEEISPFGDVQFAAFSGKAASVLHRKGCLGASTIHKLIYKPVSKSRQELDDLELELEDEKEPARRAEIQARIAKVTKELASPSFVLREDTPLLQAPLLILDEVSMVGERIGYDLESFGVKILCLGDPMQLPPISGEGYFTGRTPDTMLTEIHRSALDSPVTRLATIARTSDDDDYGIPGMDGDSGRSAAGVPLGEFDQVLVWRNATRWKVVHKMRQLAGHRGKDPQPGERIIVLANNADLQVLNGQIFTLREVAPGVVRDTFQTTVESEDGDERELIVYADGFKDKEGEDKVKRIGWAGPIAAATYAHALTVHKAQGSQWPSVLVLDESRGVARMSGADIAQRWFYTALTRASERVVIRPPIR